MRFFQKKSIFRVFALAVISFSLATSCSTTQWHGKEKNPDQALSEQLETLRKAKAEGYAGELERMKLERLLLKYPRHVPTLLANATIAYGANQPIKAQRYLDSLFRIAKKHPDAGVLRTRLALEESNLSFARRFVEQQIQYTPDHSGLHEVYAAVLYFQKEWEAANKALQKAKEFGAPSWRVAFHSGLIEETKGNSSEAMKHYKLCLIVKPDHKEAASRLRGLGVK